MIKSKVSIKKINHDYSIIEDVQSCINLLNIGRFFLPNKTFFLKVNLIRGESPPRSTSIPVVRGVLNMLKKLSPKKIIIGEGAAFPGPTRRMEPAYRELGYADLAREYNADLIDLNHPPFCKYSVKNFILHKEFILHKIFKTVDYLISIPILKTTMPTIITLGMKNLIGIAPGEIYGYPKLKLHKADASMHRTVIDLNQIIKPSLVVIDGLTGMSDIPINPPINIIIAGTDPVATDSIGAMIMGFDPYYIELIRTANSSGLGSYKLEHIEIIGSEINEVKRDFPYPAKLIFKETERGRVVSPIFPKSGNYKKLKASLNLLE